MKKEELINRIIKVVLMLILAGGIKTVYYCAKAIHSNDEQDVADEFVESLGYGYLKEENANKSAKTDKKTEEKNKSPSGYVEPLKMVYVEGGEFVMGKFKYDSEYKFNKDVFPHKVYVSSFKMSSTEITQSLYKEIMQDKNWYNPKKINCPIEDVSWYNAIEFCNKLSERDGFEKCYTIDGKTVTCNFEANGYRLPTEAEWEFAALGGNLTHGYDLSGSNGSEGICDNDADEVYDVAKYKPNELGLYDMSGNAFEWCWDWYDDTLEMKTPSRNPKGPKNADNKLLTKVIKGGCFYKVPSIQYRGAANPETALIGEHGSQAVGFRICQSVGE